MRYRRCTNVTITSALYATTTPSTREILRVRVRRVAGGATEILQSILQIGCGAVYPATRVSLLRRHREARIVSGVSRARGSSIAMDIARRVAAASRRVVSSAPIVLRKCARDASLPRESRFASFVDRHLELAELKRPNVGARAGNAARVTLSSARKRSVLPLNRVQVLSALCRSIYRVCVCVFDKYDV